VTDPLVLSIPEEFVERIASRAAALVLEQLNGHASSNGAAKYLSPADAGALIGKSRQRIYDLLAIGRLTRYRDGSSVLVSVEELEDYLSGKPTGRAAR
jgi:excisionase family DNA binding protein